MASCTRKMFRGLAEQYKALKPGEGDSATAHHVWSEMVMATMSVLKAENANFREDLFLKACGADG